MPETNPTTKIKVSFKKATKMNSESYEDNMDFDINDIKDEVIALVKAIKNKTGYKETEGKNKEANQDTDNQDIRSKLMKIMEK